MAKRKLTDEQVREIREARCTVKRWKHSKHKDQSVRALAWRFGVARAAIHHVVVGATYKDVG